MNSIFQKLTAKESAMILELLPVQDAAFIMFQMPLFKMKDVLTYLSTRKEIDILAAILEETNA